MCLPIDSVCVRYSDNNINQEYQCTESTTHTNCIYFCNNLGIATNFGRNLFYGFKRSNGIITNISVLKDLVSMLLSRVEHLESANALLRSENAALKAENEELKSRLNKNSSNSHKPPSTDGLNKKPAFSRSKGRATGGQAGHTGRTLTMVDEPDRIVIHHAAECPCCHKAFSSSDVGQIGTKRPVFDLPSPRLEVEKHQIGIITCCGAQHKGAFPELVGQPVQYGPKIKAMSVLLNVDYKLPFEKVEQLFGDLFSCSFNESTAVSANAACHEALAATEEYIKEQILSSPVAHFDETGMRVEDKLHWFHVASTVLFTYLFVHAKRGADALLSTSSLIKEFKNWAVHDCWESYFDFLGCRHVLCNAHILRELTALIENGSVWAAEMHKLLMEIYKESEKATKILPNKEIWIERYKLACQHADKEEPPPVQGKRGRPKNSKGRNLLNRLVKHQDGVLAFAFEQGIPFTNNQAERDIRHLKTKQKVATSFRTFKGAEQYARIQAFVSSLRKHNMNVFQNLVIVLQNKTVDFTAA